MRTSLPKGFSPNGGSNKPTIFQSALKTPRVRQKIIRIFTPNHNRKQKTRPGTKFYSSFKFLSSLPESLYSFQQIRSLRLINPVPPSSSPDSETIYLTPLSDSSSLKITHFPLTHYRMRMPSSAIIIVKFP